MGARGGPTAGVCVRRSSVRDVARAGACRGTRKSRRPFSRSAGGRGFRRPRIGAPSRATSRRAG